MPEITEEQGESREQAEDKAPLPCGMCGSEFQKCEGHKPVNGEDYFYTFWLHRQSNDCLLAHTLSPEDIPRWNEFMRALTTAQATAGIWLPLEELEERIQGIINEFNRSHRGTKGLSAFIAAKLKESAK